MGNNTISQKIDAYAQANLKALKQEEAKTGKHLTKYDIAERMVKSKKLTSGELNSWLKTSEGNKECSLSAAQKKALKNTSAWIVAGFGGINNEENTHYTARLENASKKAPKNPVEKQNAISGYHIKLNETVAERRKRYAEIEKQIQEQKAIDPKKALEEQNFRKQVNENINNRIDDLKSKEMYTGEKFIDEDLNKTAVELFKEITESSGSAKGIDKVSTSDEIAQNVEIYIDRSDMSVTNYKARLENWQKSNEKEIASLKAFISKQEKNMPKTIAEYKQRVDSEEFLSQYISDSDQLEAYKNGNFAPLKKALEEKLQNYKEELQSKREIAVSLINAIHDLEMRTQDGIITKKEQVEIEQKIEPDN